MPYYEPPEYRKTTEEDYVKMAGNVVDYCALADKPLHERVELAKTFGANWASILSGCGDQ